MKHSLTHILFTIILSVSSLKSFGQQILGMDTAIVDVLAEFYFSGDYKAVEKNYFGMVLLDSSSGLDTILPAEECSYQYCPSDDSYINMINNRIRECYIANVALLDPYDMRISFMSLGKLFPSANKSEKEDMTSIFHYVESQFYNNMFGDTTKYVTRATCFNYPFQDEQFLLFDDKFEFQEGYYYQIQRYRMAYMLMQDEGDSILRLAYYNPLGPVIFPTKGNYWKITPAGKPITFAMKGVCATHIHKYMDNDVSKVAIPYLYDYVSDAKPKTKSKSRSARKRNRGGKNYIIIL